MHSLLHYTIVKKFTVLSTRCSSGTPKEYAISVAFLSVIILMQEASQNSGSVPEYEDLVVSNVTECGNVYFGRKDHSVTTRVMKCHHLARLQLEKSAVAEHSSDLSHSLHSAQQEQTG